jgi:hypothetical protein
MGIVEKEGTYKKERDTSGITAGRKEVHPGWSAVPFLVSM